MVSDTDIYERQGFGGALRPVGQPGLLLVDFVNGFIDSALFGGGNIADAVRATRPVLDFARRHKWPVVHTRIVFSEDGSDANVFTQKAPSLLGLVENDKASAVVDELAPAPGEHVVRKTAPSAFGNTDLASWLTYRGVQSLVICGCTTSGCVRASVVDAMTIGFLPFVASDCCGDRADGPHEANLFDMRQKYAEVRPWQDLLPLFEASAEARIQA